MTSAARKHLVVGLKGSGKTTFLAALWHLLESGEAPTLLRSRQLVDDREYLNQIRDAWLSFEEVGRTPMRAEEELTIPLLDVSTEARFDVLIPDLSGESYAVQWSERHTSGKFAELARACDGLVLFIHPNSVKPADRIPPAPDVEATALGSTESDVPDWMPEMAPTQVQLVDLLQIIESLRQLETPLPVAVIVSAWDLVHGFLPAAWLSRRLPLLAQFLAMRRLSFPYAVYGVSAQGGDLVADRKRLLEVTSSAERVRVVEGRHDAHSDLTVPLRYLLYALGG